MASSSSSSSSSPGNPTHELMKKIRTHEIAIAELNSLPPSRASYQKNGNIFFRRNVKALVASEQKQIDTAKAQFKKHNSGDRPNI